MKLTINSKKLGREVTFFSPTNGGYIWVDLNGKPGTLGNQICDNGALMGNTISVTDDEKKFEKKCKSWWKSYLRNVDAE